MSNLETTPNAAASAETDVSAAAEQRQLELALLRSELAAQYRDEMLALRREVAERDDRGKARPGGQRRGGQRRGGQRRGKRLLDDKAEAEVQEFIASLSEKREQKKYQLSLIKEYLADPSRFGGQADVIPTSTTLEEFEERKRDLKFRIGLLKMLLALAEEEMQLLVRAETYTRAEAAKAAEAATLAPQPNASSA